MPKIVLLLVEAAVELVPQEIRNHPVIQAYCRRRRQDPRWVILDSSYHHSAMKNLSNYQKRGRPDILHFTLLEALGSPLNLAGMLEVYCHTQDGAFIEVNPEVRLPRVYERFKGLLSQLYRQGTIKTEQGEILLKMEKKSITEAISSIRPRRVYLLSEEGRRVKRSEIEEIFKATDRPLFMVGCYPHGDFQEETKKLAEEPLSLSERRLEAWTAVSRLLCIAEQALNIT
jgi:rRNA small subunit pseudouridine methyltransferase Nep1